MITIRKFDMKDFDNVVAMYKDFIKTIYPNRKLGFDIAFYEAVINWIKSGKHIYMSQTAQGAITGFSVCSIDLNNHITEPVYFGEIAYVKPIYRGGKSAYLLYNNGSNIAKELGLKLFANAFLSKDNVDRIQKKFGMQPQFIVMERN